MLTFHLLFRGLDVSHHAWHVDAIPVQVFQEDISISSSQRASLEETTDTHIRAGMPKVMLTELVVLGTTSGNLNSATARVQWLEQTKQIWSIPLGLHNTDASL